MYNKYTWKQIELTVNKLTVINLTWASTSIIPRSLPATGSQRIGYIGQFVLPRKCTALIYSSGW